jgi:hypothetical protein
MDDWPVDAKDELDAVTLKSSQCSKIVSYVGGTYGHMRRLTGIPVRGQKKLYEIVEYNLRAKKATDIPPGFELRSLMPRHLSTLCGNRKIVLSPESLRTPPPDHRGKTYQTHGSDGRPFLVSIYKKGNRVGVYMVDHERYYIPDTVYTTYENNDNWMFTKRMLMLQYNRVWVGKSLDRASYADGISILVKQGTRVYTWIGSMILQFESKTDIKTFVPNVRSSGVPHPYAVDADGGIHLLIENVKLKRVPEDFREDPVDYFDKASLLSPDLNLSDDSNGGDTSSYLFSKLEAGVDTFTFRWTHAPYREYKILSTSGELRAVDRNGTKVPLTPCKFAKIMKDHAKRMGFEPMRTKILMGKPKPSNGRGL